MKKIFTLKVGLLSVLFVVSICLFLFQCGGSIMKCLGGNSIIFTRTFFHLAIPFFLTTLILFLTSDKTFIKWLKFAVGWIILSLIFISATPEYSGGWVSFTPDREQVSIWMSGLFLAISLVLIAYWSSKEKSQK